MYKHNTSVMKHGGSLFRHSMKKFKSNYFNLKLLKIKFDQILVTFSNVIN